ncbi:16S rRNA (uracil(1498)-N(3))-methyltransferase [Trichocoleus sp. FACHB-262]|uniref:16S rRNA (uracil(1498)-N(3))-methyltransferase n=1 Tax=Trichocoleus sp. FACHB-262 TaxID=2692869 RepID=UPI0016895CFB|nr:16S rRNA (uracil(1498)-N(3))-methyltransferase [Trichocoleus sp. FACHB-262]MBD2120049.1 16S rRNA (uracil(1498)-N(3))-methyltransferase [Trichocoleus sp. FACHB-262]
MAELQRLAIAPTQLHQEQICLTAEQQHYLSRVLRLRSGDRFIAMNGQGQWWLAELLASPDQSLEAQIIQTLTVDTELPIAIMLVVALPKGSGFDEVVRQATELGISCIAPVISDRTLLHPSPQKLERWRRIAQEAAEQSERQVVPTILEPVPLAPQLQQLLATTPGTPKAVGYLCITRYDAPHLLNCLQRDLGFGNQQPSLSALSSMVIVTGPEGGWTEAEVEQAIALGYQPVSLGQRILKAVTAPLVALSLVAAVAEATPSPISTTLTG